MWKNIEEYPPFTRMDLGLLSVNRFCIFKVQMIREDRQATLTEN